MTCCGGRRHSREREKLNNRTEKGQPMSYMKSHDKIGTTSTTQSPLSRVSKRTRGQSHGPITRLMSPSDFGRLLKPFASVDLLNNQANPFPGFGRHPHSAIA